MDIATPQKHMAKDMELLVVGEGRKTRPDAVTVDVNPRVEPDVLHNLEHFPWPFERNQFREIICHHVLEHLFRFTEVLNELHRICKTDGQIRIQVPHFSSRYAHSPGHIYSFNIDSFAPYVTGSDFNHGFNWIDTDCRFRLMDRRITFHKAYRQFFLHKLFNRFPVAYERFWTYLFPAENLEIELQPLK